MSNKRNIFQEVGNDEKLQTTAKGAIDQMGRANRPLTAYWVLGLIILVIAIITVGGLTRLTDSGLSITEWAPFMGAIPPLSAADWQAAFTAYQTTYVFQTHNVTMTLGEFKVIFWWEWGHRQLGRFIGLFWLFAYAYLWVSKSLPTRCRLPLFWIGPFIALQGFIGWLMVASGLEGTRTDVASYWLMTHLGAAFALLGYLFWQYFTLRQSESDLLQNRRQRDEKSAQYALWLLAAVYIQILIGALVAGIDAGRNYIDWPLMAGSFLPPFMFELEPMWRNFFENDGTVQFMHRIWGYTLFAFAIFIGMRAAKSAFKVVRRSFARFGMLLMVQMVMGIITVMYSAPWYFAIVHQFLAIVLWFAIIFALFISNYPIKDELSKK